MGNKAVESVKAICSEFAKALQEGCNIVALYEYSFGDNKILCG